MVKDCYNNAIKCYGKLFMDIRKKNQLSTKNIINLINLNLLEILEVEGCVVRKSFIEKLSYLLEDARETFNLKDRTIIYGLALLRRVFKVVKGKQYVKDHNNLIYVFVACLVLGYKMEKIDHEDNSKWCMIFFGTSSSLWFNTFEIDVIKLLNFDLSIFKEEIEILENEIAV
jgi:hypothetical protein